MSFLPLTRQDALKAWADFLPSVPNYAKRRNHVEPLHRNVSRLSAALRFRTILEDEVLRDSLRRHPFQGIEKWVQEVCWRRYWKGWLERRPDVWDSWRRRVRELNATLPAATLQRAQAVAFAPTVGPVADLLPQVRRHLHAAGIVLTLIRRASDAHAFELAGSVFFPFWEKMGRHLRQEKNLYADL